MRLTCSQCGSSHEVADEKVGGAIEIGCPTCAATPAPGRPGRPLPGVPPPPSAFGPPPEPIRAKSYDISVAEAAGRGLRFEDGELAEYTGDDGCRIVVRARLNEAAQAWRLVYVREA